MWTGLKEVKSIIRDSEWQKEYCTVQVVDLLTYGRRFDHAYKERRIAVVDILLLMDTDMRSLSNHLALSSSRHIQILPELTHDMDPGEQVPPDTPF